MITGSLRYRHGDFGLFDENHLDSATNLLKTNGWQKADGVYTNKPVLRPWRLEIGSIVYSAILIEVRHQLDISELPKQVA
jgi:hypothetical protein